MLSKNVLELQQSHTGPALSGCWKLAPGRAISLQPRKAAVLRLSQGRLWVTVDGPHQGHGNESGDHFLLAGQELLVCAGQRLVLESWPDASGAPVYFEWAPLAAGGTGRASRWQAANQPALSSRFTLAALSPIC